MRVEARGWSGEEKEMKARDSVFLLHRQTYTHQLMPISSTKVRQEKIQNLEKPAYGGRVSVRLWDSP